jgi:hypothetical protein
MVEGRTTRPAANWILPPRERGSVTAGKREKERARQEHQRAKLERRAKRRQEKAETVRVPGEDPDIAGIVPGPQPDLDPEDPGP